MLSLKCKHKGQITNQDCFECFELKKFRKFTDENYLSRPNCKKDNILEQIRIDDPDPVVKKKERKKKKVVSLNKLVPANVDTSAMSGYELKRDVAKEKLTNFFPNTENITDNTLKITDGNDFFVIIKFKLQKKRKSSEICVRTTIHDENNKKIVTYGERDGYIPIKSICKKIIKYANCLNPIKS